MYKSYALIKEKSNSHIDLHRKKEICLQEGFIRIDICMVGLCRTDLYVANNIIPLKKDIVLGHECSGIVRESCHPDFHSGDRIVINPYYQGFMGLDYDGCLQNWMDVLPEQLIKNPYSSLSDKMAAYIEPVASSLAVLKHLPVLQKGIKIGIWGDNRIAELTRIILDSYGIESDEIKNEKFEENSYDYIIETQMDSMNSEQILKALKSEGVLLLKSRQTKALCVIPADWIKKEITIKCVHYADFQFSLNWLYKNQDKIKHLLGPVYEFQEWMKAFQHAEKNMHQKVFIEVNNKDKKCVV